MEPHQSELARPAALTARQGTRRALDLVGIEALDL